MFIERDVVVVFLTRLQSRTHSRERHDFTHLSKLIQFIGKEGFTRSNSRKAKPTDFHGEKVRVLTLLPKQRQIAHAHAHRLSDAADDRLVFR